MHRSTGQSDRVPLPSSPRHRTEGLCSPPLCLGTGRRDRFPNPVHHSSGRRERVPTPQHINSQRVDELEGCQGTQAVGGLLPRGGGREGGFWGGGGASGAIWGVHAPKAKRWSIKGPLPPLALPLTIPSPEPLQPTGSAMPAMLMRLNKIPQSSFMATFATSLLCILDHNNNLDRSLGLELGLGLRLGLGSPSWWNQSWFYNPLHGLGWT